MQVGLYLLVGDCSSELLNNALLVRLPVAICLRLKSFSYCPRESLSSPICRCSFPFLMFLTFWGATEGEAPSISATLMMFLTLMSLRREGSGLARGAESWAACSSSERCFFPTPQKRLLSPPFGQTRRSDWLFDRAILSEGGVPTSDGYFLEGEGALLYHNFIGSPIIKQLDVMLKNRSFKENSFARGRGSKGKEGSIELERSKQSTSRCEEGRLPSDKLNASSHWCNPSISQNILKEIINYSNISSSSCKTSKATTIAVFDKGDTLMPQFARMNKKSSLGEFNPRKEAKKLTLQFIEGQKGKRIEAVQMTKSLAQEEGHAEKIERALEVERGRSIEAASVAPEEVSRLEVQKSQISACLQELAILEESIQNQFSEAIPHWESLQAAEKLLVELERESQTLEKSYLGHKGELEELNVELFAVSKSFISSRREWEAKGYGAREQILQDAESCHQDFLRKLTVKDFQDNVLFNMKVAIPDYRGRTNVRGIYEELFRSKSAKKFTMILKKHSAQMDLYDGKLLTEFSRRINDLESLFWRSEAEARHPDHGFIDPMAALVGRIDFLREAAAAEQARMKEIRARRQQAEEEVASCMRRIQSIIEELNRQLKGEYERETEQEADFVPLLQEKLMRKYGEFKELRERRAKAQQEVRLVHQKLRTCLPLQF